MVRAITKSKTEHTSTAPDDALSEMDAMDKQRRKKRKAAGGKPSVPAAQPEIHIEIDRQGNIVLETVGTTGNQCDLLAGVLENSLGSVSSRMDKETYHDG